jgi:hypothetical protein
MGKYIFEQSKAVRANVALKALRPGEAPVGSLTSEEQKWLVTAFAQLNRIYEKRRAGSPGKNAFCVFEAGSVYVQFLASWDADQLVCEAASAKSVPEIASILQADGNNVLRSLGFNDPEISPNYSQTIDIKGVNDIGYATRLGFRTLKKAYRVTDFGAATFRVNSPINSSS